MLPLEVPTKQTPHVKLYTSHYNERFVQRYLFCKLSSHKLVQECVDRNTSRRHDHKRLYHILQLYDMWQIVNTEHLYNITCTKILYYIVAIHNACLRQHVCCHNSRYDNTAVMCYLL